MLLVAGSQALADDETLHCLRVERDQRVEVVPLPVDRFLRRGEDEGQDGVALAADLGRKTRPDIKLGICGEHGGDPSSVEFCHKVGLTYVSC